MTIAEFLEARIAEDEAVAREATKGPWEVKPTKGDQPWIVEPGSEYWLAITSSDPAAPKDANAQHIARHNPARVLAECAAKRAIINNSADAQPGYMDDPHWNESALYSLAAVYASHPDYDPRWAL